MTPKVPISDTGTATLGMKVARALRRNRKTTRITRHDGDQQRPLHVVDRGADGHGLIHAQCHVDGLRDGTL